jgi:predicted phage replisome organizer
MADVKWIKITTDIFDDEKILLIESMPDAYAIITVWFKLLCLAGKQNNSGVFMMGKIAYTDKMLATIFRMKESTVTMALQTFEQFEMIEIIDGIITIPNWEKHQSLEKLEQAREQTRKRVARHREKQKLLAECNGTSNGDVTQSNADRIDKDKDIDKELKKERKKERSYEEILTDHYIEGDLRDLYLEYIKMRKMIKAPMTDRALTMLINKVNELEPNSLENQKKLLETAIMNNWKSVYPLKDTVKADKQPSKQEEELLKMFGG